VPERSLFDRGQPVPDSFSSSWSVLSCAWRESALYSWDEFPGRAVSGTVRPAGGHNARDAANAMSQVLEPVHGDGPVVSLLRPRIGPE
jgi:hypothetical protein